MWGSLALTLSEDALASLCDDVGCHRCRVVCDDGTRVKRLAAVCRAAVGVGRESVVAFASRRSRHVVRQKYNKIEN